MLPERKSIRLREYDYASAGAYFVTICTKAHAYSLGSVINDRVGLNPYGHIVAECWRWLDHHYPTVTLDEWVIMPNYLHGIVVLTNDHVHDRLPQAASRTPDSAPCSGVVVKKKPLGQIVGSFKARSARMINHMRRSGDGSIWHRNYYEHIIRDEYELCEIRQYIQANPIEWSLRRDPYNLCK